MRENCLERMNIEIIKRYLWFIINIKRSINWKNTDAAYFSASLWNFAHLLWRILTKGSSLLFEYFHIWIPYSHQNRWNPNEVESSLYLHILWFSDVLLDILIERSIISSEFRKKLHFSVQNFILSVFTLFSPCFLTGKNPFEVQLQIWNQCLWVRCHFWWKNSNVRKKLI